MDGGNAESLTNSPYVSEATAARSVAQSAGVGSLTEKRFFKSAAMAGSCAMASSSTWRARASMAGVISVRE